MLGILCWVYYTEYTIEGITIYYAVYTTVGILHCVYTTWYITCIVSILYLAYYNRYIILGILQHSLVPIKHRLLGRFGFHKAKGYCKIRCISVRKA